MAQRIVGLDRQMQIIGRIRTGDRVTAKKGETRPHVLDKPRLTSSTRQLLDQAATLYGGTVEPWQDAPPGPRQWELYIEQEELPIVIPPLETLSQCYECWSARGCLRRCDGQQITHALDPTEKGQPCVCPQDLDDRLEQAAKGEACKLTTRISCMLPDIQGIGLWGLTTHSYYAAVGTAGMVEMLETLAKEGRICEAVLKIERQTRQGRHGRRNFAIPTILPKVTPRQLFDPEMRRALLLEPSTPPHPDEGRKALPEHIADLYGDPATAPAGEAGADFLARIEALIFQQGGDLAQWTAWAQDQCGKPQAQFMVADYERWLQAVEVVAKRGPRQSPPQTAQAHQRAAEELAGALPAFVDHDSGEIRPLEPGQRDLWQQEEDAQRAEQETPSPPAQKDL